MLSNISWSEYLTFIFISALLWYAFVFFTCYASDFVRIARGKNSSSKNSLSFTGGMHEMPLNQSPYPTENYGPKSIDIFQIVQSFTDEVNAYFESVNAEEVEKENLVLGLQTIISKFPSIQNSEYKEPLSQNIIDQVKINLGFLLNDDDLRRIWNEA